MQRAEPPPQTLNVLLVGTDEDTESRIRNQLLRTNYKITPHPNFNSALELSAKEKSDVDLVLSDVSLKVEEGYEFIKQVQRWRKNIPHVVIFEAGRLGHHEITKAYKLGACYILQKPVSKSSDEIRNLWKHVFKWRAQNVGSSSLVSSQQESLERGNKFMNHGKEPSLKKQRMVCNEELDALFVKVGKDAGPIRILEAINRHRDQTFLTREQVGSHLQKHRKKEKKKELHQRHMNNANGRNAVTVNQIPPRSDIKTPPLISSSSHHDMSHLHLPETSTTDSPPLLPQMQRHHIVCQEQTQHEPHEQHLACRPMEFNNFGAVTSLIGNGSNNLTSVPDCHVNTTRSAMHRPDRITSSKSNMPQQRQPQEGPSTSFEGKETNMLQQPITQNLTSGMQQVDQNPGMQHLGQNPSSGSGIISQNQGPSTSFERINIEQQPITQNLNSNTQQLGQTSYDLYAPIRSSDDGMITPEATHVDEFWAALLNQQVDIFPNLEGFLDDYQ